MQQLACHGQVEGQIAITVFSGLSSPYNGVIHNGVIISRNENLLSDLVMAMPMVLGLSVMSMKIAAIKHEAKRLRQHE